MDRFDRIFQLRQILRDRLRLAPANKLMNCLECSQAMLSRDIAFLLDTLCAPIDAVREPGYRLDTAQGFELPCLRFPGECRHPDQEGRFDSHGSYRLAIPYAAHPVTRR